MPEDAKIDEQELRVAVLMNGGVSLAVYMGGITRELDRLRRRDGPYGAIAELTRTRPRVDVIAGSSAGGINGAALAVAIARGGHVGPIRDIWMNEGSIGDLLRDPLRRDAPSLFYGDDRLLSGLGKGLDEVAKAGDDDAVSDQPLHLTITGTTLRGEVKAYADHFGAVIPDVDHRARFVFRRGRVGEVPEEDEDWPDTFAGPDALAQIALAARSSASFPVAFEPSYCPVHAAGPDPDHPDMVAAASFAQSRWVIDGGVLVNTPFRPALDAIATLAAERSVRRVLAYVVPHPVAPKPEPDDRDDMPLALGVATDASSRLPRVQSIGRELEDIAANNKRVAKRRDSRSSVLRDLSPDELETAARSLLPAYLSVRGEAAVTDIVDLMLEGRRERELEEWRRAPGPGRPPPAPWPRGPSIEQVDELREALRRERDAPWLPDIETAFTGSIDEWSWGLAPIENAANLTLDLLRRAVDAVGSDSDRKGIRELRRRLHDQLAALRLALRHNREFWQRRHADPWGPVSVRSAMVDWRGIANEAKPIGIELAGILIDASRLLDGALAGGEKFERLRGRLRTLNEPRPGEAPAAELTLRRLLALDVIQRASGAELTGIEQSIELVLMSADAANAFDERTHAEEKLAGLQAAHFGSFYKRSWRANDWLWGRLDGADRVARAAIDPRRIWRRLLDEPDTAVDSLLAEIRSIAAPAASEAEAPLDGPGCSWLTERWDEHEADARAELKGLGPESTPTDLRICHEAVRRRLQLEILCEEIEMVRDAARADMAAGTARDAAGALWQGNLPNGPLDGRAAIEAFRSCEIGAETLGDEAGSDYFTSVVTRTLGVAGSVVGATVTWRPLRPVLSTVRGILLTLYLLGRGVVAGSRTGNFLVALVLALGGALVALSLLGVDVPGLLLLLGATLLVAAVLLALVRRTWVRLVAVLVLYVATVFAYYRVQGWGARPSWVDPVAVTAAIALLAAGTTLLGYTGPRDRGHRSA